LPIIRPRDYATTPQLDLWRFELVLVGEQRYEIFLGVPEQLLTSERVLKAVIAVANAVAALP
jgi:hypothetical protein